MSEELCWSNKLFFIVMPSVISKAFILFYIMFLVFYFPSLKVIHMFSMQDFEKQFTLPLGKKLTHSLSHLYARARIESVVHQG
jgi:hypothetical protein